ncbi:MAG: acyl-CoA dehydrogenase family protein [Microthrixaceae bacterium]
MPYALEDDPVGYSPDLWAQLGELGILGMTIPEPHGGSGMTMQEGVVVYEELGRSLAPTPHLVSCVASAGVVERRVRRSGRRVGTEAGVG